MARSKKRKPEWMQRESRSRDSARAAARFRRVQRIYAVTVWVSTLGLVVFLTAGLLRIFFGTEDVRIPCVLFPLAVLAIAESFRARCYWRG